MLSIITINFNTTDYVIDLIRSIYRGQYPPGFIERILVVDNGSNDYHRSRLGQFEDPLVKKIFLARSVSFSAANNIAIQQAGSEYLCLLNPDTLIVDHSLKIMVDYLENHPNVYAVGPQFWFDKQKRILLPPNELPTFTGYLHLLLSHLNTHFMFQESLRRSRYALSYWQSTTPQEIRMLSGACIVTSQKVLEKVGTLDERYPLYFEDTDWCRRVLQHGGKLLYVPQAQLIHLYNKSAGQNHPEALRKSAESEKAYFSKYYSITGRVLLALLRRVRQKYRPEKILREAENLETQYLPFELDLAETDPTGNCEISPTPFFSLTGLVFPKEKKIRFSKETWQDLTGQEWYLRLVNSDGTKILKAWRFYLDKDLHQDSKWKLLPYTSNDEKGILMLFKQVFGVDRTLERWQWEYAKNPAGQYHIMLAQNAQGEIIGNYSSIPVRVQYFNRQYTFGQVVDTMIQQDSRGGFGRFLLIKKLTFAFYETFGSEDKEAVMYGLPNETAYTIGTKKLGYIPLKPITYLTKFLHERKFSRRACAEVTCEQIDTFGSEADGIWNEYRNNSPIAIIKDAEYLNWRYSRCPDIHYAKFLIRLDQKPIGYVVMKDSFAGEQHHCPNEPLGVIVDWIIPHNYKHCYEAIVGFCEQWAVEHNVARLVVMFPDHTDLNTFFQSIGYEKFQSRYTLVAKTFSDKVILDDVSKHWCYTLGDFDIV